MESKMKPVIHGLIVATLVAASSTVFAQTSAESAQMDAVASAKNFDVFVDTPTGFAFVKLPDGWKFAGKVGPDDMQHLPSTVLLTSIVPKEPVQMAEGYADK
jgi:hypothetical protein